MRGRSAESFQPVYRQEINDVAQIRLYHAMMSYLAAVTLHHPPESEVADQRSSDTLPAWLVATSPATDRLIIDVKGQLYVQKWHTKGSEAFVKNEFYNRELHGDLDEWTTEEALSAMQERNAAA